MLRQFIAACLLATSLALPAHAQSKEAVLYKNPQCGCCEGYADYMRADGYTVTVKPTHDMNLIKKQLGIPAELEGCHTTLIGDYVIEGHVPLGILKRFLDEKPAIKGLSLPGMPLGSPGMSGDKEEPFTVHQFGNGTSKVYAVE